MLESLPAVNATLNGVSALLLLAGWRAIRREQVGRHKACMLAALVSSALFLTCYLVYHYRHGATRFPVGGFWKGVYYFVLVPHVILAMVMLPMIYLTLRRALAGQFDRHVRIARWTLPVWLYVSVTGVLVYMMLYHVRW